MGLVAAIGIGIALGLIVGWYSLRQLESGALQGESRTTTVSRAAQRLRHGFVVAQIALAFVLLSGADLLALSLGNVMALSPGFAVERTLSGHVSAAREQLSRGRVDLDLCRTRAAKRRLDAWRPVGRLCDERAAQRQRHQECGTREGPHVPARRVAPRPLFLRGKGDYFSAMGLPLRRGRYLTAADSRGSTRVCVVDEDFARRYWPGWARARPADLPGKR